MLTGREEKAIVRAIPRGEFRGVGEPDRLTLSSSVMCCTMFPWNSIRERKLVKIGIENSTIQVEGTYCPDNIVQALSLCFHIDAKSLQQYRIWCHAY